MARLLSVAAILAISASFVVSNLVSAQESSTQCKNCPITCKACPASCDHDKQSCEGCPASCTSGKACQTTTIKKFEFGLPGLDFVFDSADESCNEKKTTAKPQNEIEIQFTYDTDLPFVTNLPYVNRLFKNSCASTQESKTDCATSCAQGKDCAASKQCNITVCQESCESIECSETKCCEMAKTCCPTSGICAVKMQKSCEGCETPAWVQLTGFVQEEVADGTPEHSEFIEQLIELRVENQRLHAQLEATEHQMRLLREMCEVREQNAALKAKLELMERHHARMPLPASHSKPMRATIVNPPLLPSANQPQTSTLPPPNYSTKHKPNQPAAVFAPYTDAAHNHHLLLPPLPQVSGHYQAVAPVDILRLAEQVKALQRELKEAKKKQAEKRDVSVR